MKKVVVVGANGFTGRRLLRHLAAQSRYEVYGLSLRADQWPEAGYRFAEADLSDHSAIHRLLHEIQPDGVINTSALSVPDYCESNHDRAYAVNVAAVAHLADCCNALGCRFIHLSTDFVFDGELRTPYVEDYPPHPVNYYGQTKWEGEQAVASRCANHAIARVSVVYGKALPGQHGNILQLVKTKLERGETIRVVSDQWRTPTWVGDVAAGIELLLHSPLTGIYHISGSECLSIAEIAFRVAGHFHLDASLIHPVTTAQMQEVVVRPRFSALSINKACRQLGYHPHSLTEGMNDLA